MSKNSTYGIFVSIMIRLKSGNLRIFEPSEWILNLNGSKCRFPKIIFSDTKLDPVSWELRIENTLSNFCVGVGMGGNHVKNFSHISKDAKIPHFLISISSQGVKGKNDFVWKTDQKWKLRGLKLLGLSQNQIGAKITNYG